MYLSVKNSNYQDKENQLSDIILIEYTNSLTRIL